MATVFQVSTAFLPVPKIIKLLENPPDDGITTLPPAKPKGGRSTFTSPDVTVRKVQMIQNSIIHIIELVDSSSICRDSADTQYMLIQTNVSKSPKQLTYKPL